MAGLLNYIVSGLVIEIAPKLFQKIHWCKTRSTPKTRTGILKPVEFANASVKRL